MASKVRKALNTAKLLIETQVLSDGYLIKHDTTYTISIRHCLYSASESTKTHGH